MIPYLTSYVDLYVRDVPIIDMLGFPCGCNCITECCMSPFTVDYHTVRKSKVPGNKKTPCYTPLYFIVFQYTTGQQSINIGVANITENT